MRITRCCNNYGPYQYPEKVIPLFVTNLLDGQARSRCTATAATSAAGSTSTTTAAASSWCWSRARAAEIYHINGDAELTNRELTAAILKCCGAAWDMVAPVAGPQGP